LQWQVHAIVHGESKSNEVSGNQAKSGYDDIFRSVGLDDDPENVRRFC